MPYIYMFGKKIFMSSPVFSVIHAIYDHFLLTHCCTKGLVLYSSQSLLFNRTLTIIWNADPVYNLVICTCTSVCIVHILITALKVDVLWKHRWKHHWKRVVKEMFNILVILNFIFLSCSPYSRNITRPFPSIKKTLDLTEKAEWRSDWYTTVYGNLRLRILARRRELNHRI